MSWLTLRPDIRNPRFEHAFRGKGDDIFALVNLGRDTGITFKSADDARAVAAACTEAAEALDRLEAEGATAPGKPTAFRNFPPPSGMDDQAAEDNGVTG